MIQTELRTCSCGTLYEIRVVIIFRVDEICDPLFDQRKRTYSCHVQCTALHRIDGRTFSRYLKRQKKRKKHEKIMWKIKAKKA